KAVEWVGLRPRGCRFDPLLVNAGVYYSGATWPTQVVPRGNPTRPSSSCNPPLTRTDLAVDRRSTTVVRWSDGGPAAVLRWSGGGSRWLTGGSPSLTAFDRPRGCHVDYHVAGDCPIGCCHMAWRLSNRIDPTLRRGAYGSYKLILLLKLKKDFDINSPLGEQVVDFLMENKDVAGLPRHLVKQLFSQLVKNLSSTKRMSDEPLGDDSKPRSYDVTFSNPLFDFNDDFTLCNDNLLFDEEFEDISSLDSPKSAPLNYEPIGNPDSMSRSLETSDLIMEELTAEIGLDDSIPTKIDDGYYDSEGDIIFLEHLLIE
ncbi:hypothetical protein Tco_0647796, partial [Tanacetum coccineum]